MKLNCYDYLGIIIFKIFILNCFQELSSNWMRNVPKMVRRRGAIMPQPVSSCAPTPSPTPLDVQNADIIWDTDRCKVSPDADSSNYNSVAISSVICFRAGSMRAMK